MSDLPPMSIFFSGIEARCSTRGQARGASPRRAKRVRLGHSVNVQLCRTTGGAEVAWLDVERRELFTDEPPTASARKPEDAGAGTAVEAPTAPAKRIRARQDR